MKYPEKQFKVFVDCLRALEPLTNINESTIETLHYMIFQQFSEGKTHNSFYLLPCGRVQRYGKLTEAEKSEAVKFFDFDFDFELYPEGCNDTHIKTACKNALKALNKL